MARRLRQVNQVPLDVGMADEEQPSLNPDPWIETKKAKSWFRWTEISSLQVLLVVFTMINLVLGIHFILRANSKDSVLQRPQGCDNIEQGYQCQPEISHSWGQYSPFFRIPSELSPETPANCEITFAQVLSRHGGRDPTMGKSILYAETIDKIKRSGRTFDGIYAFLNDYTYHLGADQLTAFGEQQMVNSGMNFFTRYSDLAIATVPFIRATDQQRVKESAQRFSRGFHDAKLATKAPKDQDYPYPIVLISEEPGSNNTLDHGLCTAFEASLIGPQAQSTFASTFLPPIAARLNHHLPAINLTDQETLFLMDLCPFETVASLLGNPSAFCSLFTKAEWTAYDYYQTVGKYYGYGPGNPLGPSQGVGYVNELIARLTGEAVIDHTSSNTTLNADPETFPLGKNLYADFGHDNDMTAVFAALGLYNSTPPLSKSEIMSIEEMRGYSAAWTVPFAARMVAEKMVCDGAEGELVRVLVNGRVVPLEWCKGRGDGFGMCGLGEFVEGLGFARGGGRWERCF